jgi:hypothetical protein
LCFAGLEADCWEDLLKYDTPHTAAKIQYMVQQLTLKLTVEQNAKEGVDKIAKLYQLEGDRKSGAAAEAKRAESTQKIVLLNQALKRYGNLDLDIVDEDQRDGPSPPKNSPIISPYTCFLFAILFPISLY